MKYFAVLLNEAEYFESFTVFFGRKATRNKHTHEYFNDRAFGSATNFQSIKQD